MSETGTISFTIGEEFGIRLMEIAQEKLISDNTPIKAIEFLTESLHGCSVDMAVKILKGDIILLVDEDDQSLMPATRIPEFHDKIFPKINPIYFMELKKSQISKHAEELQDEWYRLQRQISKDDYMFFPNISYDSIFKFAAGNDTYLLEELRLNTEINNIGTLVKTSKAFIVNASKIKDTIIWMYENWSEFDEGFEKTYEFIDIKGEISDHLISLMQMMQETLNMDFKVEIEDQGIKRYIQAAQAIDAAMSKGIAPVNIMDKWTAGWLSPSGDYYALNGEIANMLHIQIADALQKKGLVPSNEDEFGNKPNPDSWLEQNGWVKVHENMVNFGGSLNYKSNKANAYMNALQIDIITEYIQLCHRGDMLLGWKRSRMSADRFKMKANNDIIMLSREYFDF